MLLSLSLSRTPTAAHQHPLPVSLTPTPTHQHPVAVSLSHTHCSPPAPSSCLSHTHCSPQHPISPPTTTSAVRTPISLKLCLLRQMWRKRVPSFNFFITGSGQIALLRLAPNKGGRKSIFVSFVADRSVIRNDASSNSTSECNDATARLHAELRRKDRHYMLNGDGRTDITC